MNFELIVTQRTALRLDTQAYQWTRRRVFICARREQENTTFVLA